MLDPVQWYWGEGKGTSSATIFTGLAWVLSGIMYAGPSFGRGLPPAPGTLWYLDGAKANYAGHWPTKPLRFFDKSKAIHEAPATPPPGPVPCKGCPSETVQGGSSTG